MARSVEKVGKTVQDAIAAALDALNLTIEDVHVDVLDEGKPGLFGILSGKQARVHVTELDSVVLDKPASAVNKINPSNSGTDAFEAFNDTRAESLKTDSAADSAETSETPGDEYDTDIENSNYDFNTDSDPDAQKAAAFLSELFEKIGISASLYFEPTVSGFLINIESDDSGILIGHRGETLDAFQYLLNLYMNRGRDGFVRIPIDVENYKKKREAALKRLADRLADKVVRLRRNFTLEPMNAYERRIIHSYLQNNPRVETYSVGEEPNRKVMVTLKRG